MWLSSFPNIICWRDYPFPIVYSWLLCCKLIDYIVGLFLGCPFCSIDPWVVFNANILLFWLLLLWNIGWNQEVCCLQLFSSFLRLHQLFWIFCDYIQILGLFYFCEKCHCNFNGDWIESGDCFGDYGHFNNSNSSNPWAQDISPFHLFVSF